MSDANDLWKKPEQDQLAKHRAPSYLHSLTESAQHPPVQFNRAGFTFLFFGVLVPICMITVEMTSHVCAHMFFDPLPTFGHALLVSLIPLSNALFFVACYQDMSDNYAFMTLASGMAVGVGIMYTLMLSPCLLSPLFFAFFFALISIPCSLKAGKGVCALADLRKTSFDPHQTKHFGHLIILVAVVALELPSTLTRIHLADATRGYTEQSLDAIKWLRQFGNQDVMLRACYEHSGRATDIVGTLYESSNPISIEAARNAFYRVTGKPFNSVPIPSDMRATMEHAGLIGDAFSSQMNAGVTDEFDLDPDIAGEKVSGVARGLAVSQSLLSGKIDNEMAVADFTLNFTLENNSEVDREARAKILLPAGGVVDSAYIIANEKKREAQIQPRAQARAAYRASVAVRHDPLLVSSCGTDEVLVQCYPVSGRSKMDVSLHMVAPVLVDPFTHKATLSLPTFVEKNFQADVPVDVRVEATAPVSLIRTTAATTPPPSLLIAPPPVLSRILTQTLNLSELCTSNPIISVERHSQDVFQCETFGRPSLTFVCGPKYVRPANLYIIIDGSGGMKPYIDQMVAALRELPPGIKVTIRLVGDNPQAWVCQSLKSADRDLAAALSQIARPESYAGGQDCSPMLEQCLSQMQSDSDAILWIHAAQPIAPLVPSYFTGNSKRIYDMQVCPAPDSVRDLTLRGLVRVATAGNVTDSLTSLINRWKYGLNHADERVDACVTLNHEPGAHEIEELQAKRAAYESDSTFGAQIDAQNALAEHIVTPVSSLVVCDEQPQFVLALAKRKAHYGHRYRPEGEVNERNMTLESTPSGMKGSIDAQYVDEANSASPPAQTESMKGIVGGEAFRSTVSQLNQLSSASSQSSYGYGAAKVPSPAPSVALGQAVGDEFASGGTTGNFSNDPMSRLNTGSQTTQLEQAVAPALQGATSASVDPYPSSPSVDSERTMGIENQDKDAPQLQGATNGTFAVQPPAVQLRSATNSPSTAIGSFMPRLSQQRQSCAVGDTVGSPECEDPAAKLLRAVLMFFVIFVPILMIAGSGIYIGKKKKGL